MADDGLKELAAHVPEMKRIADDLGEEIEKTSDVYFLLLNNRHISHDGNFGKYAKEYEEFASDWRALYSSVLSFLSCAQTDIRLPIKHSIDGYERDDHELEERLLDLLVVD